MIEPILQSAAEINRVYMIGGGVLLYILFLWNQKLVKKIAKWTMSLVTITLMVILIQEIVNGRRAPEFPQQHEREPVVQSQYYQDPMAQAQELGTPGK